MKITFLGTGTSCGVPQVGCTCPVCTSTDPHDDRLRSSVLVDTAHNHLLIDCGPTSGSRCGDNHFANSTPY